MAQVEYGAEEFGYCSEATPPGMFEKAGHSGPGAVAALLNRNEDWIWFRTWGSLPGSVTSEKIDRMKWKIIEDKDYGHKNLFPVGNRE